MASSEKLKLSCKEKDREDKSSVLWSEKQHLFKHMLRTMSWVLRADTEQCPLTGT